jgi:hypothetical protein
MVLWGLQLRLSQHSGLQDGRAFSQPNPGDYSTSARHYTKLRQPGLVHSRRYRRVDHPLAPFWYASYGLPRCFEAVQWSGSEEALFR